jgi:6-phosphofructokinase 1
MIVFMGNLKGACMFGQSGGPTAVINASAAGVFTEALSQEDITAVYGAAHGIKGILNENFYDITREDKAELQRLKTTPSAALGSVRYKLKDFEQDETEYKRLLDVFQKYNIRYFFYNGGNDSMDTCDKISQYLKKSGYECRILGVPKTIDNDLYGTDHCPGYGSAAKYIATALMEAYLDARVYDTGMVTVMEIMGRNAGWLTASAALATHAGYGPELIYLPEIPFEIDKFVSDVEEVYRKTNKVMVAVSEGIRDKDGNYIAEMTLHQHGRDAFGHVQLGGAAAVLTRILGQKLNVKLRNIEFSLLQRCAAHCASLTDVNEAFMAGQDAVRLAIEGKSDGMVAFERAPGPEYRCGTTLVEVKQVSNKEKVVPREWINKEGHGLKDEFIQYALPLIQGESYPQRVNGLPRFANLKKIPVKAPESL